MSTSSSDQDHHRMLNFSTRKKLQGPRPAALKLNKFSSEITKTKKSESGGGGGQRRSPVVIYLVSPKVIHVRPEEFMGLVQRLTGKQAPPPPPSSGREMENNDKSVVDDVGNDVDDQFISSPAASGHMAAYSSFSIDIYSDWGEF